LFTPVARSSSSIDCRHWLSDIGHIVHTHAYINHVGMTDLFPEITTVGISRLEMEFAASGIMGPLMYTAADTKHLIDRLHTPPMCCGPRSSAASWN